MPEKRNNSLIPLSREHHFALQLCWKINKGIQLEIEGDRISNYIQWFYNHYLSNHFHEEENYLFPLLGIDNKHIQQALDEHSKLKQIILQNDIEYTSLSEFALMLNNHIRFEERILFNEIQQKVSVNELKMVEGKFTHNQFIENEKDEFWITK